VAERPATGPARYGADVPPEVRAEYLSLLTELPWSGGLLDRAGQRRSDEILGRLLADSATRVVEIRSGRTRLAEAGRLALRAPVPADVHRIGVFLGVDGSTAYVAVQAGGTGPGESGDDRSGDDRASADTGWHSLRSAAPRLEPLHGELLVQAVALLNWHGAHPRCSRCGAMTTVRAAGYERICPADGSSHHPRSDPAVIMAVVDDADRLLLARHQSWPDGRFSVLAGFVEPGESLEQAVRREVGEEAGVAVGEVRYLGSQPWPFPSSLMIGFRATATSTQLQVDGVEVSEARWFHRGELLSLIERGAVGLSPRLSIARHLVESWYGGVLPDPPG
jgi:NAD+ diphosphatase